MPVLHRLSTLAIAVAGLAINHAAQAAVVTLTGWAQMPAAIFSPGPTSGQFAAPNPYGTNLPPYTGQQPVQGFSGVLVGPTSESFRVLTDNGFGAQGNSADTLLRMYTVRPDFRTAAGGSGSVAAANWTTGETTSSFEAGTRITLSDPNRLLGLGIQAHYTHYYNNPANAAVDASIRSARLLTGADFDTESVRQDRQGNLWFGDEFGPYLIKTNAQGQVLRAAIPLPGIYSPQHPAVLSGSATANLPASGGFEGMALNASGDKLYTLLEKSVNGDPAKSLRINVFDLNTEQYTNTQFLYQLDNDATAIGDMTALDNQRFIVIERDNDTATSGTPYKKLYLIDTAGVANGGFVKKTELANLMAIADPNDLNRDGSISFTFPYFTIEDLLVIDPSTLLLINDNNFPYGGGRALASDNTEFLKLSITQSVPEPASLALVALCLLAISVTRRPPRG